MSRVHPQTSKPAARATRHVELPLGDKSPPITAGVSCPLGATVLEGGVNFSVFSRTATVMELLLFDGGE